MRDHIGYSIEARALAFETESNSVVDESMSVAVLHGTHGKSYSSRDNFQDNLNPICSMVVPLNHIVKSFHRWIIQAFLVK